MNERLIGRKEPVAAREQVAFEHAFHGVLAQHLDDPAVGRQFAAVRVFREVLCDPEFLRDFVDILQLIRSVFVRPEHAEVLLISVQLHDIAQKFAHYARRFHFDITGLVDAHADVAEGGPVVRECAVAQRRSGDRRELRRRAV